jgi:cytochrome c-type biogenesis protein CcmF
VKRNGTPLGTIAPAKFIYHRMPDSPTTEVGLLRGWRDDLYVAVGTVNPQSGQATFQFHVNPFVSWIWLGLLILIGGATVSLWPEPSAARAGAWAVARASAAVAASAGAALWLAASPAVGRTVPRDAGTEVLRQSLQARDANHSTQRGTPSP